MQITCTQCGTAYGVEQSRCPRCGSQRSSAPPGNGAPAPPSSAAQGELARIEGFPRFCFSVGQFLSFLGCLGVLIGVGYLLCNPVEGRALLGSWVVLWLTVGGVAGLCFCLAMLMLFSQAKDMPLDFLEELQRLRREVAELRERLGGSKQSQDRGNPP